MDFTSSKPDAFDYEGVRRVNTKKGLSEEDPNDWGVFNNKRPQSAENVSPEPQTRQHSELPEIEAERRSLAQGGHTLSFVAFFLFTVVLYVRPYETIPAFSSLTSLAFYVGLVTLIIFVITQIALEGNLTAPLREIILVVLLGILAMLSIPFAIDSAEAWKTFNEILLKALLMFIVMANVIRTWTRLTLLIVVTMAVSIYLSVNALSDYQHGIFVIGKADLARIGGSIGGLFKNSNDLALHLVTIVPIAVGFGLATKGHVRKLLFWAAAALMVAATTVTFSRGGFLGLIGVALVFAYKFGKRNKVATMAVLAFAAILFISFAPGSYGDRLTTIFDSASDLTGSSSQRTQVLKRSVIVALRYPLFGVGIGNFHHRSFQELGTHNAYTQVASEIGLPAFLVYMMFLLYPLKRLRQIEKETFGKPESRRFYYMSIGLQGAIIGYMVSSFFGAVAYQWYIYYLVGYAVGLHRLFLNQASLPGVSLVKPFPKAPKDAEVVNRPQFAGTSQV